MTAKTLWTENEDLYALMCLRATIGVAAFASEKQGDPLDPTLCEWPGEWFDVPGFWFEAWPSTIWLKVLFLDPSKGKDARRGDYSAFVRLGADTSGILYVEGDLKRRNTEQIVADGVEHVRLWQPERFGIETNQFQELLAPLFLAAAKAQGLHLPIEQVENTVNKQVRIRRLGSWLSQRKIRFRSRSPGTALLVQQLRDFPIGDHDDGADALEGAIRVATGLLAGRQPERVTGRVMP